MAGMPQKMLEHLLETRLDARHLSARDEDIIRPYSSATDMFLDDFLLTHIMFMPTHQLITELMRKYPFRSWSTVPILVLRFVVVIVAVIV